MMNIAFLDRHRLWFPDPGQFGTNDIVAVGGDLRPARLLYNYYRGSFPWSGPGDPLLWWHPRKRMILRPEEVHIGKTSRNLLNRNEFQFTFNQAFREVIDACRSIPREGQEGTWITEDLRRSFLELHRAGYAHSAEVWQAEELVGGLYGLQIGKVFCGESMFSHSSNASKLGFIKWCQYLAQGAYRLIDCQVHTDYLASLGAYEVDRENFLDLLYEHRGNPPALNQ